MKLYCLSGLGVDKKAFQNIKPEGIELIHIDWINPLPFESIPKYSRRLYDAIQPEDEYNLIGVSFGGIIAAEFSKIKKPNKMFLVSTISNRSELSLLFKLGLIMKLYKLIPSGLMLRSTSIANYLFSVKTDGDKKLLKEILQDTDPSYLSWAINAIREWDNTDKPDSIRIHGTRDRMLPQKSAVNYELINAGHFMIVDRGKEITDIIEIELSSPL